MLCKSKSGLGLDLEFITLRTPTPAQNQYCKTGNFHDMIISLIAASGGARQENFVNFWIEGFLNIRVQKIFANPRKYSKFTNISCTRIFPVLQYMKALDFYPSKELTGSFSWAPNTRMISLNDVLF